MSPAHDLVTVVDPCKHCDLPTGSGGIQQILYVGKTAAGIGYTEASASFTPIGAASGHDPIVIGNSNTRREVATQVLGRACRGCRIPQCCTRGVTTISTRISTSRDIPIV